MNFGLKKEQLNQIIKVLSKYKNIDKAILFGSRATVNYKKYSDIDLVIIENNVDIALATKIKSELEDTYLPFFFDVISYNAITSEELKQHIQKYGKVIYKASN